MANFFDLDGLDNHVCLLGPSQSGKSSLLFQHAVSCARNGHCIVFVTPKPLERLPLLMNSSQVPLSHKTLSRIHFKYPTTLAALQELFDHAHLPDGLVSHSPECVIIDNLHHYFNHLGSGHDVTAAVVKTCAHIVDSLAYITSPVAAASTTHPIADGDRKPVSPVCFLSLPAQQQHLNTDIIRRWFPHVLKISETRPKAFCLERDNIGGDKQLLLSFKFQKTHFEISNENST